MKIYFVGNQKRETVFQTVSEWGLIVKNVA